jgi:hypothetical protein
MADYRLYCLNDAGGFSKSHDISADSDDEAIDKAEELKLPVRCELWQQGRFVATLDPHDADRHAY